MPQLLIIKSGNRYYRFKDHHYHACALNKASVFPLDNIDTVKELLHRLVDDGIRNPYIARLTITEEPYTEEESSNYL